jgi:hypothetical protein
MGVNQLSYVKYKRGLLTDDETEALKNQICPASDQKKAKKKTFFLDGKAMEIKHFKNEGFLHILDSSTLCVDKADREEVQSQMREVLVEFELKAKLLDEDDTYMNIVTCKFPSRE